MMVTHLLEARLTEAARVLASPLAFDTVGAWGRAAQRATTDALGADKSFVHWVGVDDFMSESFSAADLAAYRQFFPLLQEIECFERVSRHGVVTRREAYGPHYDRMQRTAYVQEYIPSTGSSDSLTITAPATTRPASSPEVHLLVHLTTPGRIFGRVHTEAAWRLRPALVAGVAVQRQMARVRGDLMGLVDVAGGACAVFSTDGDLLHVSRALEEALAREPRRDALLDRVRLVASESLASPAQAGDGSFAGAAGRYRLSASMASGARPLLVVAVEVPRAPRRRPSRDEVAERFGLTPRQAEVAVLLAERRSNREIAAALSVSVHTARHHVEAVLDRLGVRRGDVSAWLA